ncbi:MAG: TonB-dependent receptor [Bacteroidetes bacterium]|nr:TonB-dependent receptor [Bacteroidota bacterium]
MNNFFLHIIRIATFLLLPLSAFSFSISGKVISVDDSLDVEHAQVTIEETNQKTFTNQKGEFSFANISSGTYTLVVHAQNKQPQKTTVVVRDKDIWVSFKLSLEITKTEVVVIEKSKNSSIGKLNAVEGTSIYEGKKSEVIDMNNTSGNKSTNNAREIYGKVSGLNIWESDGAGIQLSIGGRGLNPNRVSNFNTRQNGYDISADALGYPESYYSPPSEAIDKIEIVRGAASLQYGTQFGGFLNFNLKKGPENKKLEFTTRQTTGSWGFVNSFNSIGGTVGKLTYYAYAQRKQGEGWRPNADFSVNAGYASLQYKFSAKFKIGLEYTAMQYLAHQPGGLTDGMYKQNPQQSIRERNWFNVNWNLMAFTLDYNFSEKTRLNFRAFGLLASRDALGTLDQINRADEGTERNLLNDQYKNFGSEIRWLHYYSLWKIPSVFLIGGRYYQGQTDRKQGLADSTNQPHFTFLNAANPEFSAYTFPSRNIAVFSENIFKVSKKLSITPGVRFEYIDTRSGGYYNIENKNLAGQVIYHEQKSDNRESKRSFVLAGIGLSYDVTNNTELYSNFSQNYRSINFNDMRVVNPNFQVDPNLKDETGFTCDLGYRGSYKNFLYFDATFFYLGYNNRIGSVLKTDTTSYTVYALRTNVSDSRTYGFESLVEVDFYKWLIKGKKDMKISVFSNLSWMNASYTGSKEKAFEGKRVELVPPVLFKSGLKFKYKKFGASYQYSYTAQQFTDATNSTFTANAVNGLIPAYNVMDLSLSYTYKLFTLEGSINNLLDNRYFTRRAEAYPGPGIIPSDARSFYLTVQVKL